MSANSISRESFRPEKRGMGTATKVVLLLGTFIILLGILSMFFAFFLATAVGFTVARSVETEGVHVATVAEGIAQFDLPSGYGDDAWSISRFGFSLVGYDGADNHSHIMFAQIPSWVRVDRSEFEQQARTAAEGETTMWQDDYRFDIVDERTVTIRGQEEIMTIGEGTNHDGDLYREIIIPFEGKGGQALLLVVEPIATWDQAEIDTFVASIR